MKDPIPFPPEKERNEIVEALEEQFEHQREIVKELSPELVRWMTNANKLMYEQNREAVSERLASIAGQYLRAFCSFGKELLGDAWDDRYGPHYMAGIVNAFIQGSCPHCLMQQPKPDLCIVENDDGTT